MIPRRKSQIDRQEGLAGDRKSLLRRLCGGMGLLGTGIGESVLACVLEILSLFSTIRRQEVSVFRGPGVGFCTLSAAQLDHRGFVTPSVVLAA